MSRRFAYLVSGLAVVVPLQASAETLGEYRKSSRSESYEPETQERLRLAERLFKLLLAAGAGDGGRDGARSLLKELSFELLPVSHQGETIHILREEARRRAGRGFYAFRAGRRRALALEAPHSRDDLHTGDIAERLFLEGAGAAAAWSTAPRNGAQGSPGAGADLCHAGDSMLHSFTRAFAAVYPDGLIVQLHGFAGRRTPGRRQGPADVILSDGTRLPPPGLRDLAACLGPHFDAGVALFPGDVEELGGTANAQGELLRRLGHRGFVHVELSPEARRSLKRNGDLRRTFLRCLCERRL